MILIINTKYRRPINSTH